MISKLKKAYLLLKNWFWALPIWKRAILSSFLGAIGGSSIIGFFNRYALYYHAFKQGFRLPIEGVEYINFAISLLSFAFIIISIFGTIIIYSTLNTIAEAFTKLFAKSTKFGKGKTLKIITMISQVSIIAIGIIAFSDKLFKQFAELIRPEFSLTASTIVGISLIVITIGYLFANNESGRKQFTLTVVFIGISLLTVSLFNQSVYKSFLKNIKYGGDLPVKVEYRKADNTASELSGNLLIKTNHTLTIRNPINKNIEEIPIERISKIIYKK